MEMDWSSEIEGIPLRKIRDLLKRVDRGFVPPFVTKHLGIPESHAGRVVAALCKDNLVKREHDDWFVLTIKGHALAMALIRKPIDRAKADAVVEQLLSRISSINQDPYFLYMVTEASVFGSYVGDAPSLGDVDIVFKLEVRPPWTPEEALRESVERASLMNAHVSFHSRLNYGRNEVIKELKAVSRYLSLHEEGDASELEVKPVPLYVRGR
jgi:hypothetical protein